METQNYIEIFQDKELGITLDVKLDGETLWLDQYQLEKLFDTDRTSVGRHLRNIYASNEIMASGNIKIEISFSRCLRNTKARLAQFHGINKEKFLLHLKECEFRFNHRDIDVYRLLLKSFRDKPLF